MNGPFGKRWTSVILGALALGVSGCSHQAPRVDCDKHLEAINAPLRKEKAPVAEPDQKAPATETSTP